MTNDEDYNKWKEGVNNHREVLNRGEKLYSPNEIKRLSQPSTWSIIRDIILFIFILLFLTLISIKIFYPENYKDLVETVLVCDPTVNLNQTDVYNNISLSCDNICEFPSELTIKFTNST